MFLTEVLALSALILGACMWGLLACQDRSTYTVSVVPMVGVGLLGLGWRALQGSSWQEGLRNALILGLLAELLRIVYRYTRGKEGMGQGDSYALGSAAAWIDWALIPWFVSIVGVGGLLLHLFPSFSEKIPLVPAIAVAWGIFLGGQILLD